MKPLFLLAITATLAAAESHPSWWMYASPEATALVGIHWNNLRHSPFAAAVDAEISGTLGFPDLACLKQAREVIISSPPLLAAEAGTFPAATVKDQAQRQGLHRSVYRGIPLWIPEKAGKLGVAQVSEQLLLVGDQSALRDSIDRSLLETGRMYSQLLPRAARFSQTGDLWVVASTLPDPLASLFVPLEGDVTEFLGQISVRDGLSAQASFDAGSSKEAVEFAQVLRKRMASLPGIARGLEASTEQSRVSIALQASPSEVIAALQPATAPEPALIASVAALPAESAVAVPASAVTQLPPAVAQGPSLATSEPSSPVKFELTHLESAQPQVVRIFGLDDGPREIVLQP